MNGETATALGVPPRTSVAETSATSVGSVPLLTVQDIGVVPLAANFCGWAPPLVDGKGDIAPMESGRNGMLTADFAGTDSAIASTQDHILAPI
jgi:hypothetical protein